MGNKFYRPEIDGLRALAIIPVVLFHAEIFGFQGGFVGVDIFFVISGFLITSILIREMKNGNFSFVTFWERRVRRILPALVVVVSVTCVIGTVLLTFPNDLADFGKSIIAQSFFLSNIFFMRRQGYFAAPPEASPLLHTWTLSVEEQFYILFPALLFLIYTYMRRHIMLALVLLATASFALSVYLVSIVPGHSFTVPFFPDIWGGTINKTAGFYLLPTRAWELLIGALLAVSAFTVHSKKLAEVLSVGGVCAILYAITQFDSGTPFPGFAALLPTLGSAAIIVSNTEIKTIVGKILSLRYVVWVGLISYSLYLWHWPVFAFANILFVEKSVLQVCMLIVLSVVLAYISYALIETPFRTKNKTHDKRYVIAVGLSLLALLSVVGYSLKYIDTTGRIPSHAQKFAIVDENLGPREVECFRERNSERYETEGPCLLGKKTEVISPSFVVWGDSHAGMLLSTIDMTSERNGVQGVLFGTPGCIPIPNVSSNPPSEECEKIKSLASAYIRNHDIKHILLVARWNIYTVPEDNARTNTLIVETNSGREETTTHESKIVFENNLRNMIIEMNSEGRTVYVLKQVPEQADFNRKYFYSLVHSNTSREYEALSLREYKEFSAFNDSVFDILASDYNLQILDPSDILCSLERGCPLESHDSVIYRDRDHLNALGADLLAPLFERFLTNEIR